MVFSGHTRSIRGVGLHDACIAARSDLPDHPLRDESVVGPGKTSETFSISNPDCCTAHIGRRPRKGGYCAPTLRVDDGVSTQFFGFCSDQRVQAFGTVITGTIVCLHRAEDFVLDPGWNCFPRNKNRTFRFASR